MKAQELVEQYKAGERDFQGVDLSKAELHNVTLNGADLSRANLSGADLSEAKLNDANLSGADLLDIVSAHVAVGGYKNLHTEMVDLGRNRYVVGFVGNVQYNIIKAGKIGDEWLRRLNLLADYAAFCGTGHKTAQGMGHAERRR